MELFDIFTQSVNAFTFVFLNCFFYSVLWKRKSNLTVYWLSIALTTAIIAGALLYFKGSLYLYICMLIPTFLLSFMYDSKLGHKFLFTFIGFAFHSIAEFIVGFSIQFALGITFAENQTGVLFLLGMLLSKFVVFIMIMVVRLKRNSLIVKKFTKEYFGIFLFPASSVILSFSLFLIFVNNPEQSMIVKTFVLIGYSMLLLANVIVFDFIDSLYKNTVNESRVSAANEIIENQRSQYEALIEHNRDILKIEHDNKNFCIGLISDLKEQRYDEIMEKLSEAHKLSLERERLSGNIISIIANIKSKEAALKNIQIDCEYNGSNKINIPATDVAIIIGNALDNAIEACEAVDNNHEKRIDMLVKQRNDNVIIIIKNPTTAVNVEELETKKQNAKYHGFGIVSMKQIAEKYNGEVMMSCEDGVFTTSIIMNNKNDDE